MVQRSQTAEGQRFEKVLSSVKDRDVVLVSGSYNDHETLEIFRTSMALMEAGAQSLLMLLAVFGGARMERKTKFGELVVAKAMARLFSGIPRCPLGNRLTACDIHADGIPYYMEGAMRAEHLYVSEHLVAWAVGLVRKNKGLPESEPIALLGTDAGRAPWIKAIAKKIANLIPVLAAKNREGTNTANAGIYGSASGHSGLMYDDLVSTGGTACTSGQAHHEAGCGEISYACTHGYFANNALNRMKTAVNKDLSPVFVGFYFSNTMPQVLKLAAANPELRVFDVTPILDDYLQNGHPLDRPEVQNLSKGAV